MNVKACVAALLLASLYLGGCAQPAEQAEPKHHRLQFVISPDPAGTITVYEKNDGSQMKVLFIGFQQQDGDPNLLPNPPIIVTEGDTVELTVINGNPLGHTLHMHGGLIEWGMDGVDFLTQMPIMQGEEFTYLFEDLKAGTYWYHCHVDGAHHIDFGMYGAFIVKEREPAFKVDREYIVLLDEVDNCHVHGNTDPVTNQEQSGSGQDSLQCFYRVALDNLAQNRGFATVGGAVPPQVSSAVCPVIESMPEDTAEQRRVKDQLLLANGCEGSHAHGTPPIQQTPREWWYDTAPIYLPVYNTFLVNGKSFPDTQVFPVKAGETVRFRVINAGNEMHSWHPHGHTMQVTHKDGYPLAGGVQRMDTLSIGPGERYDYIMEMDNPGLWMIHDQQGLATMNDDQHPGGMMACMAYDGFHGFKAFEAERSLDCNTYAVENILGGHGGH